jgi:hypothetical protein
MTINFNDTEQAGTVSDAKKLAAAGADNEIVLGFLRERGFNKLDSIKALMSVKDMSLGDSKTIVHNSRAWQDSFARDEEFHASLQKSVEDLNLGHQSPK